MAINDTVPQLLEPLASSITSFVEVVQFLVGGIFGLYIIMLALRWYEARTLRKLMAEVRDELKALSKKLDKK